MKGLLPALLLPLLTMGIQAQTQEPVAPIQEEGDFFILNFSENPEEMVTLAEFVKLCQTATGRNFTYNPQTGQGLEQGHVVMFGQKRIPKEDFYSFFQIQMFINDFVCVEVGPPHISVVLIQSLAAAANRGTTNIRQKAVYVSPDDLESFADQPATLITTVLYLPNTDARTLQTQLRALITDTTTQTFIAAGPNSVILTGFGSYVSSLARLLELVDTVSIEPDEIQPVFDVVPLAFAAAEDISDLLEQLLEAQQTSQRGRPRAVEGQGPGGALQTNDVEAKILVDARTNSLLVMAMPDEMPRIKDLVARLDVEVVEPERNFHIYSLQNVNADAISEVLDQFLSDSERITGTTQGGTGGRAGQGGGTQSARTSNEVVVVPDSNSNSLLIAANKTRYEEVRELIRQLDQRQDQVLIESALIELTGTEFRDIGFEWAFADVSGDGGYGATSFGLSELQDLDADGVFDTRVPTITNGISAGILSGDRVNLPFLIAAAQQNDNANILNVPSVLVNNNGSARVVTLDQQPTTQVTNTGVGGQTQVNFQGYEDAGITLEISPSISASRYLRLQISLTVSNFTGSFDAQNAIPPPRTTREMFTTVNVPDGDTMVIGGVISDILRESREGVPWLADLPLIGALFRRDTNTNTRTTLYFFVTPHILHDRDFADLAEISYMKKLKAAEVIGPDRVRVIDPNFGADAEDIEFEGFQVPLYRAPERGEVDPESVGLDPLRRQELLEQASGTEGEGSGSL